MQKVFFFLGKGGVGKTTLAGSLSSHLAEHGAKVFLASIDPAHNLFDFFGIRPPGSRAEVTDNLTIEEFDIDLYLRKFLKDASEKMKQTYRYLHMINLEGMFDILKYSPGMEEYAMLSALDDLFKTWKDKVDYIVIDTPPTALMLRLFSLPKSTLMWLERLKDLRARILSRRAQISHIQGSEAVGESSACESENDAIFQELSLQERLASEIWGIFSNEDACKRILVLNYDELSITEGNKIIRELGSLGIGIDLAVFNKQGISAVSAGRLEALAAEIKGVKSARIPFFRHSVTPRDKKQEIAELLTAELL